MKKMKDMNLTTKFILAISLILIVLTIFDVWFSMKREKELMYQDLKKWTFIYAENVRTFLNTLMQEDHMDLRFAVFDAMSKEIKGLEHVRVIRSPKVDEIFKRINEEEVVPREEDLIRQYEIEISERKEDLTRTSDSDEIQDIREDISSLMEDIRKAEANITEARTIKEVDEREKITDNLDNEVISKGIPVYQIEGDKARVLIPYIASKNCTTATGCHKYAENGDVLGAINMEFSIKDINQEISENNLKVIGLGIVRLIIVVGVLLFFLSIFVVRHINVILDGFSSMVKGDFRVRLPEAGDDEMGRLAKGFNYFVSRISRVIEEIQDATMKMAMTSEELSVSSAQIAKGTVSQKERSYQVSSASEELSKTINEVAENSQNALNAARGAADAAHKGGLIVSKTMDGMKGIVPIVKDSAGAVEQLGSRSREIGKIIEVIDDIADQTNLLALNAAIEAARAGGDGKGFAVVADEVRKLAERTTKATKEISLMIKSIQDQTVNAIASMDHEVKVVEDVVELAKETGIALENIVSHVERVNTIFSHVAAASEQQSVAADVISQDIDQVASVTMDTVRSVEQIASASEDLSKLASELQQMVMTFKIDTGQ